MSRVCPTVESVIDPYSLAKLPIARWDEDLEQAICSRKETRSLRDSLRCMPLACTFGIFKGYVDEVWPYVGEY